MRDIKIVPHGKFHLNHLSLFISLSLMVLLTSCATVGRKFDLSQVQTIRIGETTMSEVRDLFGKPYVKIDVATREYKLMHFGDEETKSIWRYIHASGTIGYAQARFLQVEFDNARRTGRVTDYYYSSDFESDKTEGPEKKDFDIFLGKEKIVPRETTKSEVMSLLGNNYRIIAINKPGTSERWHYGFSGKVNNNDKIYGKGLDIDFDSSGIVSSIRGESDFPADKDRFFSKTK